MSYDINNPVRIYEIPFFFFFGSNWNEFTFVANVLHYQKGPTQVTKGNIFR